MSSYCVIGSGISGATIANLLSKKNSVHIYDKARGPGGRSSFNDPTAETDTISVTPSCFKASIFALKFILDGEI